MAELKSLLTEYFGDKIQYRDGEIDLVKQLKSKTIDDKKFKVQQFMSLEAMIKDVDYMKQMYHTLGLSYQLSDEAFDDIHSQLKLSHDKIDSWLNILFRIHPKKRTLVFHGASNCGKSVVANALLYPFAPGFIQRDGGTNVHWLEGIYMKNFILWEEPSVHMSNVEDVKLVLGGETIAINRKNKHILERLAGPAVLITTNNRFWNYKPQELMNRITIEEFYRPITFKNKYEPKDFFAYLNKVWSWKIQD